jgi:SAM-dependent methyltransferase
MTDRACAVCGSNDQTHVFAESNVDMEELDQYAFASRKIPEYMHWRLIECPGCDLLYSSPLPTQEFLHQAYEEAAYDSGLEASMAAMSYGTRLPEIIDHLPDVDGAIDIGAGDGAFLKQLLDHQFTRVVGVEPSAAPIAAAAPWIKPLMVHDVFRPALFPPSSVSLVSCFQTIEHVPDPMGMVREVLRVLKPGGAAYFIAHNRRGLSVKILGMRSPIFDLEHMQLFSPASIEKLFSLAGFTNIQIRRVWNRYPQSYWVRLFPFPPGLKKAIGTVLDKTLIGRIRISIPPGNMAVIAYKPS